LIDKIFGGTILKFKKIKRTKLRKKSKPNRTNDSRNLRQEVSGIIFLTFGLLLWFSFSFEGSIGMFGNSFRSLLLGFLGLPAYFISYAIIFFSILMIVGKPIHFLKPKFNNILILLVILSAMIHAGEARQFEGRAFFSTIKSFYSMGMSRVGGGVIGGLISTPILKVFQPLGTLIILGTLSIINIIVLTDVSLIGMLEKVVDGFKFLFSLLVNGFQQFLTIFTKLFPEKEKSSLKMPPIETTMLKEEDLQKENTKNVLKKEVPSQEVTSKDKEINFIKDEDFGLEDSMEQETEVDSLEEEKTEEPKNFQEVLLTESSSQKIKYNFPNFNLLAKSKIRIGENLKAETLGTSNKKKLEETLLSFGVEAKVVHVTVGPAVTRYELTPSPGVKVSKIVALSDDISLNLATSGIRIEAPIPGKAAIGIEVPNKDTTPVLLSDVVSSEEFIKFPSKLAFALGKDISGGRVVADISKMPHLLVAGATGAGKSVCINSLIVSLLYKATPEEVKLLMIDPKVVELGIYNGIPHLLIPVVTDPKKAAGALNWAVVEMTQRYKSFAEKGVRDIHGYNNLVRETEGEPLPQIVIIIDELADLMMVAPNDVEDAICRLAQMARAAGMHLVIATQRPSVDVITGIIKANIPSRIAFAVTSQVDSRTILDMGGAEKLLGKGDMLFYPVGEPKPIRVKGSFVSDKEVEKVVQFVKNQKEAQYNEEVVEQIQSTPVGKPKNKFDAEEGDEDALLEQVTELIVNTGQASASLIQRKFKVGYARAGRIIDQLEQKKVIGPFEGGKPRQVLLTQQEFMEIQMKKEIKN
jgi:DNA segregation ATPase FtsK/SpoIIIE, S-DNA-T family